MSTHHHPDLAEPLGLNAEGKQTYLLRGAVVTDDQLLADVERQHKRDYDKDEIDRLLDQPLSGLELHVKAETLLRLQGKADYAADECGKPSDQPPDNIAHYGPDQIAHKAALKQKPTTQEGYNAAYRRAKGSK